MCDVLDVYVNELEQIVNDAVALPFDDALFDTTPGSKYQRFAIFGYQQAGKRLRETLAHVRSLDERSGSEDLLLFEKRLIQADEGPIFFGKWIVQEILAGIEECDFGSVSAVAEVAGEVSVRLAPMMAAIPNPAGHAALSDKEERDTRAFISADFINVVKHSTARRILMEEIALSIPKK